MCIRDRAKPGQGVHRLGQGACRIGSATELGAFARDVHLQEDVLDFAQGLGAVMDFVSQIGPVHRIDGIEQTHRILGLVALKLSLIHI